MRLRRFSSFPVDDRFNCLQGVSGKTLSARLRKLESDGVVLREVKPTSPPTVGMSAHAARCTPYCCRSFFSSEKRRGASRKYHTTLGVHAPPITFIHVIDGHAGGATRVFRLGTISSLRYRAETTICNNNTQSCCLWLPGYLQ